MQNKTINYNIVLLIRNHFINFISWADATSCLQGMLQIRSSKIRFFGHHLDPDTVYGGTMTYFYKAI